MIRDWSTTSVLDIRQVLDATQETDVLPALSIATVREIVTKRAERMLR